MDITVKLRPISVLIFDSEMPVYTSVFCTQVQLTVIHSHMGPVNALKSADMCSWAGRAYKIRFVFALNAF